MRCTVRRLACPQQIQQWFMQWNWLKCKSWSFSLSTFLSPPPPPSFFSQLLRFVLGRYLPKFHCKTVFPNIKSCCISQVILCHFKHTKWCYLPDITRHDATTHQVKNIIIIAIFSGCPFILNDVCKDHRKVLLHLFYYSRHHGAHSPRKLFTHKAV